MKPVNGAVMTWVRSSATIALHSDGINAIAFQKPRTHSQTSSWDGLPPSVMKAGR
jgi:hypothetical protein